MIKVRLTKLKPTPSGPVDGFTTDKPKSGSRFVYFEEDRDKKLQQMITTPVKLIYYAHANSCWFETQNSVYKLEVLDNEEIMDNKPNYNPDPRSWLARVITGWTK